MKKIIILNCLFLFFIAGCDHSKEKEQRNVGEIKCGKISSATPAEVDKCYSDYIGKFVKWEGVVADIKEAGKDMVYTENVPGLYIYAGQTSLRISLTPSGTLLHNALNLGESLTFCQYLYSKKLNNINQGDAVSFTGKIMNQIEKQNPFFKNRKMYLSFIIITSITKIKAYVGGIEY